jgi:nucleoid DNA-binding protein
VAENPPFKRKKFSKNFKTVLDKCINLMYNGKTGPKVALLSEGPPFPRYYNIMKGNSISKDELFKEISLKADFCDKELVGKMYYGLLRTMIEQLRTGKDINLPDFGVFYVHYAVPRQSRSIEDGQIRNIIGRKCLKFRPGTKIKAYFKALE